MHRRVTRIRGTSYPKGVIAAIGTALGASGGDRSATCLQTAEGKTSSVPFLLLFRSDVASKLKKENPQRLQQHSEENLTSISSLQGLWSSPTSHLPPAPDPPSISQPHDDAGPLLPRTPMSGNTPTPLALSHTRSWLLMQTLF